MADRSDRPFLSGLKAFVRRLRSDVRGNVAMIFSLTLPVLVLMTLGGVDIHRASTVRVNLQDALDAATLAAARSPYTTDTDLSRVGLAALRANLQAYPDIILREDLTTFTMTSDSVVIANSKVDVKTLVANIILPPYGKFMDDYLPVGAHSEVDRSSRNIEVALVLDMSGSMRGQKLWDLKAAAKDLVDLIVQPVQTPYYSRVALVPWSYSVNPGRYLNAVRGTVIGSTRITDIGMNLTGPQQSIRKATRERPVEITSRGHGFANGDVVWISNVSGMTQINNRAFVVADRSNNTFELNDQNGNRIDGRNYGRLSGRSGRVQKCGNNDCSLTVTSARHGLRNNDRVYITGVSGMTQVNDRIHLVGNATTDTYTIDMDATELSPYRSGGESWCARQGCTWFAFENEYRNLTTHRISDCVTERTGTEAYTDAAPTSSARVGRNYPDTRGTCMESTIQPLSSSINGIKANIDDLSVSGSTAGQIGIAWGWYMVSPNFGSLWPSSAGAAYNTAETLKAVIIMTDGEFNAPYCEGVMARGYNAPNAQSNNCDPDNGEPYAQSRALCDSMKAQGIVVYTVGFQIGNSGNAKALLQYCASSASGFYDAGSGTELSEAFNAIGRDITKLRISR
ncbi:ubiquitin-activating E1 FCCH domain-containing protein [uncultured Brevundimonas sp.]|uniref:ubiquitin-activating E1 FCCH domain-containing protein n=1 Tax=uncultured Brevundimonas sp. TaxID=213418 RepID=UPI0030ED8EFC